MSPTPEARIATDDGYFWPAPRSAMQTAAAIRQRMGEDLDRARRERLPDDCVTQDDLVRLGWTKAQVADHADAAFRTLKAACRQARAERGKDRAMQREAA